MAVPIAYTTGNSQMPLKEWLEKNKPSEKPSHGGTKWIWIRRKCHSDITLTVRLRALRDEWKKIKSSGETVNKQSIINMALKHNLTCGKWLFYAGKEVNNQWKKVASAIDKGSIPSLGAKVSTSSPGQRQHVICVYSENFIDKDEVLKCEQGLRNAGITCTMYYKPDIYTYLNIYTGNPWGMKPTMYSSYVSNSTSKSQIKCT